MASIRQAAQDVLDVAREGIGWIALWKEGRGWGSWCFWGDTDRDGTLRFGARDTEWLHDIAKLDPQAILVNGWEHNLGDPENMTRDTLAAALRWQYDHGHALLVGHLQNRAG